MNQSEYKISDSESVIITNNDNPYQQVEGRSNEPYFDPVGNPEDIELQIQAASYMDADNKIHSWPKLQLQGALINITQTKTIVRTAIAGRNGSVKEHIAMGDYMVEITATIAAPNGESAWERMNELIVVKQAPVSLKVNSKFLQQYDIYNLVINDFKVEQQMGRYSSQVVKINAFSDTPYIIEQNVERSS
jgi:hypothetical protein